MLHPILNTKSRDRVADVIFVHGINPLGTPRHEHAFGTWGGTDAKSDFWPRWLGEDLSRDGFPVAVWLYEYAAAAFAWLGDSMSIADRANSGLDMLYGEGIGRKPLVFVTHSMGGLVVKQMLFQAAIMGLETEKAVAEKTRAIVFLSTPHTGADIAAFASSLTRVFRQTDALKEMAANAPALRTQANWYLNQAPKMGVKTRAYIEKQLDHGILVVNETDGDPKVAGSSVVPVDANHSGIPKMASRDLPQYKSIRRFVEDALEGAGQANPSQARPE